MPYKNDTIGNRPPQNSLQVRLNLLLQTSLRRMLSLQANEDKRQGRNWTQHFL